jgi:CubicO group peptidase (beta-lactamase class C family)
VVSSVLGTIATWDVPNAAAAVVTPRGIIDAYGDVDRVFALASVTKPLVAFAVLVAIEEESVRLESPAGGATVRHLLSHASGMAPEERRPLAAPGRRRIYSNAGFEVLGEHLSETTGLDVETYLHESLLAPLHMTNTSLSGSPAKDAHGSVTDLARFATELMEPQLVAAATMAEATTTQFPGLDGVLPGFGRQSPNDWGLGFELRANKHPHWTGTLNSPRTFGHFGRSGTFMWVDPTRSLALVCLTDRPFGSWAATAWPDLSDDVLARW